MLVLSRKCQEAVVVGGSVDCDCLLKVTVLEITNGTVRLGFEADKAVPIHRSEIWERIQRGVQPRSPGTSSAGTAPG